MRAYTSCRDDYDPADDGFDAFVAKLDSSGNLLWNTFLGGSGADHGQAIALDGGGNIYVSGESNVTWGSPMRAYTSGTGEIPPYDAFAAKLDGSSGALIWNTFLGGSGWDEGYAVAVDGNGNIYVGGQSNAYLGLADAGLFRQWYIMPLRLSSTAAATSSGIPSSPATVMQSR